ncbi:hypothetical protein TIFTF001_027873 [Ficus carica]|uniref:Uncharacterized protein n=1 Tax=Ficus carica TaxID=3494 RepID=A0AA88DNS7_FICCA|nr:hypothetical protein TIFTF001_027873 [Ficus carica]
MVKVGVNLIDLKGGGHHGWLGYFIAHFVYCFHIAFPSHFLVPPENPNFVKSGDFHGQKIGVKTAPLIFSLVNASMNKMSVEKLVGVIISDGDRDIVLTGDLRDVFSHVDIFPTCYLPSITGVAYPATCRITGGHSPKNGMDNVLGRPGIGPVTRPWSSVWPDLASSIGCTCRARSILIGGGYRSSPLSEIWFSFFFPMGRGVSLSKEFRPLMYYFVSACFWAIPLKCAKVGGTSSVSSEQFLTCMMALSKQSRNAVEKASDSCLKESIVPGISLQYHCRAVPVRVIYSSGCRGCGDRLIRVCSDS